MSRFVFTSAAGLAMLALALPVSAAENIYCTVVGAKQGTFQSDRGPAGNLKAIPVLAFMQEVTVPYDAASGLGSGKRTHSPISIVKMLDGSSPQFFEAAVTNEILRSVTCTFYRDSGQGAAHAYFKVTLTNAAIVDLKDAGNGVNGDAPGDDRERIKLTFQKIDIEDLDSHTSAADDWTSFT